MIKLLNTHKVLRRVPAQNARQITIANIYPLPLPLCFFLFHSFPLGDPESFAVYQTLAIPFWGQGFMLIL